MPTSRPAAAIVGAMPEEIALLLDDLEGRRDRKVAGFELHLGRLEGRLVVLAHCGVGKANAAALAQALVMEGPKCLIFTGVAGAADPELRVGDIVVAADAVQHDVDVTALGYPAGTVPGEPATWRCDDDLVQIAFEAAADIAGGRVVKGRVASGDQFIADAERTRELHDRFGATCIEMEGAAVAQICARAGVPCAIIRSISDSADHDAEMSFREFTGLAAARAKLVVRKMLNRL